jgi:carbon monoxide dehydrogenase subunit G
VRFEGNETVTRTLQETWAGLNDPRALSACTPGLERLEPRDPDHYDAVLEVKLPALTGRFEGTLEYLERHPTDRARLRLQGKGPVGFVDGEVTLELSPAERGTAIHYVADVQIGGQIARLGQRMLSGVTREMAGQFFRAFEHWRPEAADVKVAAPPGRSFVALLWRSLLRILGLRRD